MKKITIMAAFLSLALLAGCGQGSPGADGPDPCGTSEDIRNAALLEAASPFGEDWQEKGTLVEYESGYISMRLTLPEGWDWQTDPAEDGTEGILFWDGEKPDQRFRLSAWPGGFGMCGTGVDFSEVTLASGAKLHRPAPGRDDEQRRLGRQVAGAGFDHSGYRPAQRGRHDGGRGHREGGGGLCGGL